MSHMEEDILRGIRAEVAQMHSESVTTDVAARALRVTPRTIRNYIEQGKLEATSQGEGVEKTWLISIESLNALREARNTSASNPRKLSERHALGTSGEDMFREIADRLEIRAAEVGELRTRLARAEQAGSTLREERQRLIEDLERELERGEQERRRAEEAERVAEQLAQEHRQAREEAQRLREELEAEWGKGFWRRLFGG